MRWLGVLKLVEIKGRWKFRRGSELPALMPDDVGGWQAVNGCRIMNFVMKLISLLLLLLLILGLHVIAGGYACTRPDELSIDLGQQ
jgi:hypothetical protein